MFCILELMLLIVLKYVGICCFEVGVFLNIEYIFFVFFLKKCWIMFIYFCRWWNWMFWFGLILRKFLFGGFFVFFFNEYIWFFYLRVIKKWLILIFFWNFGLFLNFNKFNGNILFSLGNVFNVGKNNFMLLFVMFWMKLLKICGFNCSVWVNRKIR